jgi:hypothetical protein
MGSEPLQEDAAQHRWLGSASVEEYRTATDFLLLAVKALADLLNESPLIDTVQAAYDDTIVDVVPQGVGEGEEGSINNDGRTPKGQKEKSQSERVKEALEKNYGQLSGVINGAFFDETESNGTRGTNQSQADALVEILISLMQVKMMMERFGQGEGCKVYGPEINIAETSSGKLVGKLLTVDLGEFFGTRHC